MLLFRKPHAAVIQVKYFGSIPFHAIDLFPLVPNHGGAPLMYFDIVKTMGVHVHEWKALEKMLQTETNRNVFVYVR